MKDSKENTRKFFDEQSQYYDDAETTIVSKIPNATWPEVIEEIERTKFDSLLDVGCGTGELFRLLRERNKETKLTGVDLSEEMIKAAKAKEITNCELLVGDAEHLPFDGESFDVVTCILSFQHFPEPENCIKEFYRVLKPGGCLLICEDKVPFLARFYGKKSRNPYTLSSGDYRLYKPKTLEKYLSGNDFKDVSTPMEEKVFIVKGYK